MKKTWISILVIGLLASCGNNSNTASSSGEADSANKQDNTVNATVNTSDPAIENGPDLIASSDCLTCHRVDEQLVGPSYKAVAEKYRDSSSAIVDSLTARIIRGSIGHWGQVPMAAHPSLSKDTAQMMVKYVLSLKD